MELLKDIGAVVGLVLSAVSLITICVRPIRRRVVNFIATISDKAATAETLREIKYEIKEMKEHISQNTVERRQQIAEMQDQINDIITFDKKNHEALKDMIREKIVSVYYTNLENKSLHYEEWESVSELANSYFSLGGNHFIKGLMDQMKNWTIMR